MLLSLVLALVATSPVPAPSVVASDGWSRATAPGASVAAGYLTLVGGPQGDKLLRVSTPLTPRAELHSMTMAKGVMSMRALPEGLAIAPHTTVTLKPGGLHLMFLELTKPLAVGDVVPVTLTFERAGAIEVKLKVMPMDARGPAP